MCPDGIICRVCVDLQVCGKLVVTVGSKGIPMSKRAWGKSLAETDRVTVPSRKDASYHDKLCLLSANSVGGYR